MASAIFRLNARGPDTDGQRLARINRSSMFDRKLLDSRLNSPHGVLDVMPPSVVQHDRKLLASVACRHIEWSTRTCAQGPRNLPQAFIACLVTVVVVVGFEVIDID